MERNKAFKDHSASVATGQLSRADWNPCSTSLDHICKAIVSKQLNSWRLNLTVDLASFGFRIIFEPGRCYPQTDSNTNRLFTREMDDRVHSLLRTGGLSFIEYCQPWDIRPDSLPNRRVPFPVKIGQRSFASLFANSRNRLTNRTASESPDNFCGR